jgi:hypothetical protein
MTRYPFPYQRKLGFSTIKGLPSPIHGPENHSRDSVEDSGSERCERVFSQPAGWVKGGDSRRSGPLTRFDSWLIRGRKGEARGLDSVQACEHGGRAVIHRTMRPPMVVVIAPSSQLFACFFERGEPLDIEAFIP